MIICIFSCYVMKLPSYHSPMLFQMSRSSPRETDQRRSMACKDSLRLRLPPRHRWKNESNWPHVGPGTLQHAHNWRHDDLLQDNARCRLLAVDQPVFQRHRQLHESGRRQPSQREVSLPTKKSTLRKKKTVTSGIFLQLRNPSKFMVVIKLFMLCKAITVPHVTHVRWRKLIYYPRFLRRNIDGVIT